MGNKIAQHQNKTSKNGMENNIIDLHQKITNLNKWERNGKLDLHQNKTSEKEMRRKIDLHQNKTSKTSERERWKWEKWENYEKWPKGWNERFFFWHFATFWFLTLPTQSQRFDWITTVGTSSHYCSF